MNPIDSRANSAQNSTFVFTLSDTDKATLDQAAAVSGITPEQLAGKIISDALYNSTFAELAAIVAAHSGQAEQECKQQRQTPPPAMA